MQTSQTKTDADDRIKVAYSAFRGGFGKAAFDIPATFDDLLPYMRDAMRVAYLQGTLDGSVHYASPRDGEDTSLPTLLSDALQSLEYWFKKANPDWDGSAEPGSTIAEVRAAIAKAAQPAA